MGDGHQGVKGRRRAESGGKREGENRGGYGQRHDDAGDRAVGFTESDLKYGETVEKFTNQLCEVTSASIVMRSQET